MKNTLIANSVIRALNLPRVVLCGLVTGVVFTLMTAVLVGTFGSEFLAAASAVGGEAMTGPWLYFATVAAGIWAMWLYVVVRPWFLSRWVAALAASLAWWFIASLQSLKWVLLLGMPASAVLPLAANIVPTLIAVLIGSALFGDAQPNQPLHTDAFTRAG